MCYLYPSISHRFFLCYQVLHILCLWFCLVIKIFQMEGFQIKGVQNPPQTSQRKFFLAQIALRTVGIAVTLIALGLMATSHETTEFVGIQIQAKYSYSPAFKYSVAANAIACSFSLLSMVLLFLFYCRTPLNSDQKKYFILFLVDLIVTLLELTGCAAASAIGYLGLYGNNYTGWMQICDKFGEFCHRITASIVVNYCAALIFLFLTIWSSWKSIKSQPSSSSLIY